MDCIFCKIINKEIPSNFIYEDDKVIAILDISPLCDGHSLVIPKKHYEDITAVDQETLFHMFKVANEIGSKLMKITGEKGYSLSINYGDKQEVKHLHLHVMPNYKKSATLSVEETYNLLMEK